MPSRWRERREAHKVPAAQGERRLSHTHDVFISHSSKDRAVGDAACAALERAGYTCWIAPRDIMPGDDYGEAIVDGIRASRIFLLIVSAQSIASPQVRRETERAGNAGIPIIPFRIEDVLPSKSLEFFISSAHWLDAITRPMEPHYDYLVKVVGRLRAEAEGATVPPMPMRAASTPADAPSPARAATSRVQTKPAIAIVAILAGTTMGGLAIWRNGSDRSPAVNASAPTKGPHSIFTRRATTLDARKPVRLRAQPTREAETIAIIPSNQIFYVAPRNGEWWPAQLENGAQGFIHAYFVRVIDEEGAPPVTPGNLLEPDGAVPPPIQNATQESNKQ